MLSKNFWIMITPIIGIAIPSASAADEYDEGYEFGYAQAIKAECASVDNTALMLGSDEFIDGYADGLADGEAECG